jgi:SAM-dependent methyltransferase
MNIATLWQLCLNFEYDREALVAGLGEWLGEDKSIEILDCACGTGFPSLDLIRQGYHITCTDGSRVMLAEFHRNSGGNGNHSTAYCIQWRDLAARFKGRFDVVMCRGSSLIYAGSWDDHREPDLTKIREAVKSFRECLKEDGRLYVDTTSEENLKRAEPERNKYPERIIGSNRVSLSEVICTDQERHLRTWLTEVKIDGVSYEFERHSYYLTHADLFQILTECGFKNIQRPKIRGEHYDVFTAQAARSGPRG